MRTCIYKGLCYLYVIMPKSSTSPYISWSWHNTYCIYVLSLSPSLFPSIWCLSLSFSLSFSLSPLLLFSLSLFLSPSISLPARLPVPLKASSYRYRQPYSLVDYSRCVIALLLTIEANCSQHTAWCALKPLTHCWPTVIEPERQYNCMLYLHVL